MSRSKHRNLRRGMVAGLGALVLAWLAYKTTTTRSFAPRRPVDSSCDSDPKTVARLQLPDGRITSIACEPWDVGTGVAGYVWRAPRARAALLVEHGWGDYSQRYVTQASELVPRLLERGISVYAIDLWGNGRSPGARGATDIGDAVEDHLAARRKLRDQPLPVFLLGHSVGGLVTAASLVRDQTAVHGMILIAPAVQWGIGGAMRVVASVGGFLLPTFAVPAPPGDPADQSRDRRFTDRLANDSLYLHDAITWATASSGTRISNANWNKYRSFRVPLLIVNGTADKVTGPTASRALIDMAQSTDKTLELIEGGRHALLDDPPSNAEALRIILAWLDRRAF